MANSQTNCDHNTFKVFQHVIVGKTEHAIAARSKPLVACFIMPDALHEIVAFTINFDHEFAGMRDKVRDVITHRDLTAESQGSKSMRLQVPPQ